MDMANQPIANLIEWIWRAHFLAWLAFQGTNIIKKGNGENTIHWNDQNWGSIGSTRVDGVLLMMEFFFLFFFTMAFSITSHSG
jgi:hypothetical protein